MVTESGFVDHTIPTREPRRRSLTNRCTDCSKGSMTEVGRQDAEQPYSDEWLRLLRRCNKCARERVCYMRKNIDE